MDVNIRLDAFEGPMDLLYSLIIKNKIDINDIPIAEITDQYLECVDAMKKENMESVSEFIVMASTLIEIKSRLLLPKIKTEEGEETDPRAELVERLIEYKKYKEFAEDFDDLQKNAGMFLSKSPDNKTIAKAKGDVPRQITDILNGADADMLLRAFNEAIRRRELKVDKVRSGFNTIQREEFTVESKMELISATLKRQKKTTLFSLLNEQSPKGEIIATFMAILEMVRKSRLLITQAADFCDIILTPTG
ncbi:MAG TPA: segregation/condensation protein A [Lachnospiraceae bacterium]|nr:segregation/condensation protein A [Lachnospiraceae bacterium]